MATHGFVVVVTLHSTDSVARARDLSLLIDLALARSATAGNILYGSMDPDRIGASGFSAGGGSASNAAVGITAAGLRADGRIKAMVVSEPGVNDVVDGVSAMSSSYLLLRGTQLDHVTGGMAAQKALTALFASTVASQRTPCFARAATNSGVRRYLANAGTLAAHAAVHGSCAKLRSRSAAPSFGCPPRK